MGAIGRAVEVLRAKGIVAYPTDTLYGLAVDPRSVDAVRRLFEVKQREPGHPIPLIAADPSQAEVVGLFDARARHLAATFWPGPLSLVLAARTGLVPEIVAADGSVAVRVPASEVACTLARAFGFCITSTSANLSGQAPTSSPSVVADALRGLIDYLLDAGESPGGPPSTIVDLRGSVPRLVRSGAIAWDRVLRSIE